MKAIFLTTIVASLVVISSQAQVVHPTGAAVVSVNWQSAAASDSIRFDLDQDGVPDLVFTDQNYYPTGASQPTRQYFMMRSTSPSTELGLDTLEFDSAHRFAALAPIGRGLRWESSNTYLAYVLIGNGGTGGRGFFRNGVTDYVVARKQVAGRWQYWWFNISGRSGGVPSRVNFYGTSQAPLSTASSQLSDLLQIFPNPTTTNWQLTGKGRYELFDATGRRVRAEAAPATATISSEGLPAGLYQLRFYPTTGGCIRRSLVRQ